MLWTWVIAVAMGAGFYLESGSVDSRAEGVSLQQRIEALGQRGLVVRRFVDGHGWRYLVRVEGFEDRDAAVAAASELAEGLNAGVDLLYSDGQEARLVYRQEPGQPAVAERRQPELAPPAAEEPSALSRPADTASVAAWAVLERAVVAHGVDRDSPTQWMHGPSHLEYRRTLSDGTVVDHAWWTRDGATYVTVEAVEGRAASSRVFVRPEKAWLAIGGGAWRPQSPERAAVVVADLGPAAVIPVVLGLRQAMETRPEFASIKYLGEREVGGVPSHVLAVEGTPGSPSMEIEVTRNEAWIRRVSFAGGELVHEFEDDRPVGSMMLPHRIRSVRADGEVDLVELKILETGEDALGDGFLVSGNATTPPP